MRKELKPFIHIVANLYLNYGYKEYPLCKYEQEEIDVKDINKYLSDHIMRLQACDRSQREQRERSSLQI